MSLDPEAPNWPTLLSHPAEGGREEMPLETHLTTVATRARAVTPEGLTTADGGSLREVARIAGLSHDFGKATDWFQTRIRNGSDESGPTHHARLGGLLAYYAVRTRGYGLRTRFAALAAVGKHHGTLPDHDRFAEDSLNQYRTWSDDSAGATSSAYNGAAARQAAQINRSRPDFARAVVERLVGSAGSWDDFLARLTASNDAIDTVGGSPDDSLRDWIVGDLFRGRRGRRLDGSLFEDGSTYLDELRLYGTLTFADKTHAAGVRPGDDRLHAVPATSSRIRGHISRLADGEQPDSLETRLNGLRGAIQERIAGAPSRNDPISAFLDAEPDVATLTLPTGYGKTLTGLLAATRIREATDGDRIVYALPFTSVIDQTADVIRTVLRDGPDDVDPARDRRLTVHHHLSESLTVDWGNKDPNSDKEADVEAKDADSERAVMLAESWRAGITLTTFVQLFESLAGPRNSQSMKLPGLYESVVVIDEPQALPLSWWPLVARLVDALVKAYDATVVLMTATQPRIVDEGRTFQLLGTDELAALEEEHFRNPPTRVEYEFHPTAVRTAETDRGRLGYEEAAGLLATATTAGESVLTICNTVDSTAELFDEVVAELRNSGNRHPDGVSAGYVDVAALFGQRVLDDGRVGTPATDGPERLRAEFVRSIVRLAEPDLPAVLYLSTRIRPCDRRFLLTVASELTAANVPVLVVSTQLVEAGVDVSFDRVFRDFAPLDSIVQAAGRCNRSFERAPEPGSVTVWRLGPPEGKSTTPSEVVYARRRGDTDLDLLTKTRKVLDGVDKGRPVPEARIARDAVREYHDAVGGAVDTVAADNDLRRQFEQANGASLRQASLIETQFCFEVYVCRSDAERRLVESYRQAERSYDFDEAARLKTELADLRVSVPAYRRESETARKLVELEPLSPVAEARDATERVLRTDQRGSFFDARTGVDLPDNTVEARFL